MPSIRFLISKCHTYIVILILLLGVIMPIYSYYAEKKLVCVIIVALFNYQPSSYSKYTKLNIYSFCNVKLVFNTKCAFFIYL